MDYCIPMRSLLVCDNVDKSIIEVAIHYRDEDNGFYYQDTTQNIQVH